MILDGKYVPDLLVMLPKPPGDVPDTRTKHGAFPPVGLENPELYWAQGRARPARAGPGWAGPGPGWAGPRAGPRGERSKRVLNSGLNAAAGRNHEIETLGASGANEY